MNITPPNPGKPASGLHSPENTQPGVDAEPDWAAALKNGAGRLMVIPDPGPPEPAIPLPAEALEIVRQWDGIWTSLLGITWDVIESATRACWLALVGPRWCHCIGEPHCWYCPMTPIWADTVEALNLRPDEALEQWRAYGDLAFLSIRINTREDHQ